MEGCKRREVRGVQRDLALAWRIENFSRSGKKFRPLEKYLDEMKPNDPADRAATIFKAFEKRGLAKIKERKRDGG